MDNRVMANCFSMYDINLVEQSTITASTVNALFPVSNLKDYRTSKVFRSTTNSDNLIFDFQETSEINAIFIIPSKRAGFGVSTITLEFNHSSNFTSPPYSISVPLSETLGIGYVTFPTIEYRFARIVCTSTAGYVELANVFIGKELGLTSSINFGWSYSDEQLVNKSFNRYGQIFADIISRQKAFTFSFSNIRKEDLELINVMLDRVGEVKPIYISIGDNTMSSDYRRFSGAVVLTEIPSIVNSSFNRYSLSMSAKELM